MAGFNTSTPVAGVSRFPITPAVWLASLLGLGVSRAQPIAIPNGSFELPSTFFVSTLIDFWQETPKPDWYQEGGGFKWDQLTGVFHNTQPGAGDHIDNCDGVQALYLFAVPEVGLFQDYDAVDWDDAGQVHAFDTRFETGKAYHLTFGVVGGGGNMLEGVSFEAALYYRNDAGQPVTVAATNVIHSKAAFPTRTHLTEFTLPTPTVKSDDPWAGRHVGVRFLSTVSPEMQGGYWDLDNVRLTAIGAPSFSLLAAPTAEGLRLTWPSAVGYRYQVTVSPDLATWSDQGAPLTGTGGELNVVLPLTADQAFFNVTVTPAP